MRYLERRAQTTGIHAEEGVFQNPVGLGQSADNLAMNSLAKFELLSFSTGLEYRRVGVEITCGGGAGYHAVVQE